MKNSGGLKKLKQELAFLYKLAQKVHSLEIDELLKEIVEIAVSLTKGDACLIYVLDPKKQELVLRASKNPRPDLF